MKHFALRVYFDGLCHLCSREIEHYRRCPGSDRIDFVDITGAGFSPTAEALDAVAVRRHLHVRRADGSLAVGVDAFVAIWETIPRYGMLARLARFPGVNTLLKIGYRIFARVRPLLPRKKPCANDYCTEVSK